MSQYHEFWHVAVHDTVRPTENYYFDSKRTVLASINLTYSRTAAPHILQDHNSIRVWVAQGNLLNQGPDILARRISYTPPGNIYTRPEHL
jgi:hypothetical protein